MDTRCLFLCACALTSISPKTTRKYDSRFLTVISEERKGNYSRYFDTMSSAPFIIELVVAAFMTICLLHRYGNWRKQHLIVTIAVFIAWYFSFLIIFVLPLDVSAVSIVRFVHDRSEMS